MTSDSNIEKEKLKEALDSELSSAFTAQFKKIIQNLEEDKYTFGEEVDRKLVSDLKRLVEKANNLNSKFLPYASITAIVYRTKNTTDLSNYSSLMKDAIKKLIDESDITDLGAIECVVKLMEHFDLATNQMNDLYRRQNDEIKQIEHDLEEQKRKVKDSKEQLDNVKNIKGTIYTEFITILGIFSAFIFGIFGSFQAINTTLQMFEKNKLLGKPLMMTSVIMMSLMIVLYMFISWLGFIIGRPLKRECYICAKDHKTQCDYVFRHLFYRHIGFSIGIIMMLLIFAVGLFLACKGH